MYLKALLVPLFLLSACALEPAKPQMTSLEIQAIQARTFDADKKTVFNSVMSTFQDLGYIVNSASLESGFITAESPNQNINNQIRVLGITLTQVNPDEKTFTTASFDEISNSSTRVRLNFVTRRVLGETSGGKPVMSEKQILDPQIYNNAFNKIGDAIFIRKSQTQNKKPAN